jgi:hypothetical protein
MLAEFGCLNLTDFEQISFKMVKLHCGLHSEAELCCGVVTPNDLPVGQASIARRADGIYQHPRPAAGIACFEPHL